MNSTRILIVDDDPIVRKGLQNVLTPEGYEVISVGNANDAIRLVQVQPPDLMILDINLVGECAFSGITDGFNFMHWMRYSLGQVNFPVIVYTVDSSPKVDQQAAACQAYAVVRKHEGAARLLEVVRLTLLARQTSLAQTG